MTRPGFVAGYVGTLLFVAVYCSRPNELIPGMALFPFAQIAAIVALAGFLPALIMKPAEVFPGLKAMKYLVFLFLQLSIAVPFSMWPGGSAERVFEDMSKVVIISLCIPTVVNTTSRLRWILWVQTLPVALMVLASAFGTGKVLVDSAGQVRARGWVGGIFENPNDYAFAIALVFPVAVCFFLHTRNPLGKLFWGTSSLAMVYVVFETLSRGGLLALAVAVMAILWEYGFRQKRYALLVVFAASLIVLIGAAPGAFVNRVHSMVDFTKDQTGSGWARRALLEESIRTALANPLFGVGPGNFQIVSGNWHGAHNTYTQLGSEAGLPAALFFILLLYGGITQTRRLRLNATNPEVKTLAIALNASLTCYAVGAFFADTGYHFFPYLFLAYAASLHQIALRLDGEGTGSEKISKKENGQWRAVPHLTGTVGR
ncbi:MAG: O-antigen ligase family protein [Candidatus Acidiferrales bacterium]